jgi:hypothetical protein
VAVHVRDRYGRVRATLAAFLTRIEEDWAVGAFAAVDAVTHAATPQVATKSAGGLLGHAIIESISAFNCSAGTQPFTVSPSSHVTMSPPIGQAATSAVAASSCHSLSPYPKWWLLLYVPDPNVTESVHPLSKSSQK